MTLFEALKNKTIVNIYETSPDGSVLIRLDDRTEIVIFHGIVREFDDNDSIISIFDPNGSI